MDKDYLSDSDQSDEDFRPEDVDSDIASEEESGCDEENEDNEWASTAKKSKGVVRKSKNPTKKSAVKSKANSNCEEENKDSVESEVDGEAEKKRSEALWANFLSDVGESPKQNGNSTSTSENDKTHNKVKKEIELNQSKQANKVKVTETLYFAGEKLEITKEVPSDSAPLKEDETKKSEESNNKTRKEPSKFPNIPVKRSSTGLNSVLNAINKKSKISVLEKTKLDWDNFKKKEGLNEELQTYNKGKDGFLERRDFLERTDLRQFEIEKNLRQSKRSNR